MRLALFEPRRRRVARAPDLFIVAMTADDDFYGTLTEIALSCGWILKRAGSVADVEAMMKAHPVSLVVYEPESQDARWSQVFERISSAQGRPCLLLASRAADQYLRQEVIRHRGYDVLPKFAPREQMIRSLRFAWFWKSQGAETHPQLA